MKYLKSQKTKTGQACTKIRTWMWAKPVEFFMPFLKFAETKSNVTQEKSNYSIEHIVTEDPLTIQPSNAVDTRSLAKSNDEPVPSKKRVRSTTTTSGESSAVDKVISYLHTKDNNKISCQDPSKYDAIEHMFLGFAKTIKTFPPKIQALTKMKIAQIVLEEEILQREEEDDDIIEYSNSPSYFSSTPLNIPFVLDQEESNLETETDYLSD